MSLILGHKPAWPSGQDVADAARAAAKTPEGAAPAAGPMDDLDLIRRLVPLSPSGQVEGPAEERGSIILP